MAKFITLLITFIVFGSSDTFVLTAPNSHPNAAVSRGQNVVLNEGNNKETNDEKKGFFGSILKDLQGMAENLDDVVDDFVFKRMGAGEQWYGKRKYQPSGKFEDKYQGLGLTDKLKIDTARARKEEFLAERERRRREPRV